MTVIRLFCLFVCFFMLRLELQPLVSRKKNHTRWRIRSQHNYFETNTNIWICGFSYRREVLSTTQKFLIEWKWSYLGFWSKLGKRNDLSSVSQLLQYSGHWTGLNLPFVLCFVVLHISLSFTLQGMLGNDWWRALVYRYDWLIVAIVVGEIRDGSSKGSMTTTAIDDK